MIPCNQQTPNGNSICYCSIIWCHMNQEVQILEELRELHLRMCRRFNDGVRAHGISIARLNLLALIDRWGSIRSTDIADALGQTPRTVTEAVDALERDGRVIRELDPKDRRAKRISLTEAGRAVLQEVSPYRETFAVEFFAGLDSRDVSKLLRILQRLNEQTSTLGVVGRPDQIDACGTDTGQKQSN